MNHIVQKLHFICNNLSDIQDRGERRSKMISKENIVFSITDDSVDKFDEIIKEILKQNKNLEKFSEKYIEGKVEGLIANILQNEISESTTKKKYDEILDELKLYDSEYRVLVPLTGIEVSEDKFSCGKINLLKGSPETISNIVLDIKNIIALSKHTEEEKENIVNQIREQILSCLNKVTFSEYIVKAEPIRAKERAIEETRRVIDVFRYSIPALYPDSHKIHVAIFGESCRIARSIPIISTDVKDFTIQTDFVGQLYNYKLDDNTINVLKKIGVINIFNILKKDMSSMTDFELTLLNTIHWFSNHLIQAELENKLLSLITSLESLLTPKDCNPIGTALAEGVAIILGNTVEKRKKIKIRFKQLYNIRSGVSHGGRKSVLESDIRELRYIIGLVINFQIRQINNFNTQKDLLDWIEDKKLS